MDKHPGHSMVQECTDAYRVEERPDGGLEIRISVPSRFASLWLTKLSGLTATEAEIKRPDDQEIR